MKATAFNAFMARVDAAEYGLCRRLNRGADFAPTRRVFQLASRLGNGLIWYVLILSLPLLYGAPAARPAIVMAGTGALGVAVYALLKRVFVRERPFITHAAIEPRRGAARSLQLPFRAHAARRVLHLAGDARTSPSSPGCSCRSALLIAGSRVVLGLHYPSDVLAGAASRGRGGWRSSA